MVFDDEIKKVKEKKNRSDYRTTNRLESRYSSSFAETNGYVAHHRAIYIVEQRYSKRPISRRPVVLRGIFIRPSKIAFIAENIFSFRALLVPFRELS